MPRINEFGQPIGDALPDWKPCPPPQPVTLTGRTCRLDPLNVIEHADDLFAAFSLDDGRLWTYMHEDPFTSADEFRKYVEEAVKSSDEYYAIVDLNTDKSVGMIALKRADPINGVIEAGKALFSPLLKQSMLSTEAQYLLMAYAFDQLGYRRYEWCCESRNEPARKAVTRLGFTLDGVFRNICVEKGRTCDAAWFSVLDDRWPVLKTALQAWLAPENFDENGRQIRKLEDIRSVIDRKINGIPSSL